MIEIPTRAMTLTRVACVVDRGGEDAPARGGQQIPQVLADSGPRVPRGRMSRSLPRTQCSVGATDPQHRHHDGNVRGSRLHVQLAALSNVMGSWTGVVSVICALDWAAPARRWSVSSGASLAPERMYDNC